MTNTPCQHGAADWWKEIAGMVGWSMRQEKPGCPRDTTDRLLSASLQPCPDTSFSARSRAAIQVNGNRRDYLVAAMSAQRPRCSSWKCFAASENQGSFIEKIVRRTPVGGSVNGQGVGMSQGGNCAWGLKRSGSAHTSAPRDDQQSRALERLGISTCSPNFLPSASL